MMAKTKASYLSGDVPDDPDSFFEKSPFSCETMILRFEKGDTLKLHRGLLLKYPKLATLDANSLKHISRSAGHVLVQYLYTNRYRTLKWVGPADVQQETIAKLETAFQVYATAREFDLDKLETLAIKQITLLSKDVDAFTIIDIVKKTYPAAKGNDTWFPAFVKDTIRVAFETPLPPSATETAPETIPDNAAAEEQTAKDVTLTTLLLQGALEVYREKIDALTVKSILLAVAGADAESGPSATIDSPKETAPSGTSSSVRDDPVSDSGIRGPEPVAEPVPELEVKEPEPVPEEVPEEVPVPEPMWEVPEPEEPEQPSQEPDPIQADELQPVAEPDVYDDWGLFARKKKKGKITEADRQVPLESEPQPTPEVIPEPEPEKEGGDDLWGFSTSKKVNKKKGKKSAKKKSEIWDEPESVPMEETAIVAEPAPATSPVGEGWVGDDRDPWSFWGAKKSPRSSM